MDDDEFEQVERFEEIRLNEGDGLKILEDSTSFRFGCCDCGLVHEVKIERHPDGIVLRFYRDE
jgi:hypothetical protein